MVSVLLSTTDDGDVVPDGETNSSDVTLTPNDFLPEIMCPDALYDISCDGRMLAYSPDARRIQLYDLEQGCFIQW